MVAGAADVAVGVEGVADTVVSPGLLETIANLDRLHE
jgi:hypothetical protein